MLEQIDRIYALLECQLCHKTLQDPFTLHQCGHTFCRACLVDHLAEHGTCGICQVPAAPADARQHKVINDMLSTLTELRSILDAPPPVPAVQSNEVSASTSQRRSTRKRPLRDDAMIPSSAISTDSEEDETQQFYSSQQKEQQLTMDGDASPHLQHPPRLAAAVPSSASLPLRSPPLPAALVTSRSDPLATPDVPDTASQQISPEELKKNVNVLKRKVTLRDIALFHFANECPVNVVYGEYYGKLHKRGYLTLMGDTERFDQPGDWAAAARLVLNDGALRKKIKAAAWRDIYCRDTPLETYRQRVAEACHGSHEALTQWRAAKEEEHAKRPKVDVPLLQREHTIPSAAPAAPELPRQEDDTVSRATPRKGARNAPKQPEKPPLFVTRKKETATVEVTPQSKRKRRDEPEKNNTMPADMPYLGFSGLDRDMTRELMHQFYAIWGIDAALVDRKLKTDGASQETHLVVAVKNNDLCKRTVRYITALVRRCPIVTINWVIQSINQGKKLEEADFFVQGDLTTGETMACQKALSLPHGILEGLPYMLELCSKCSDAERNQTLPLAQILQAGGANRAKRRETIAASTSHTSSSKNKKRRTLMIHCEHREGTVPTNEHFRLCTPMSLLEAICKMDTTFFE